ncbi:MAG: hypothetical protein RLZZ244_1555 [Verrucomicrobiota bacterium]|jgi:predicted PurR-regulated permease PerM
MKNDRYPTPWQKKTLWSSLTALAIVLIGAIAVGGIYLVSKVLSFLQPILIPFAVAGVLAYLLEPLVSKLLSWGIPRRHSVLAVFGVVSALLLWGVIWLVPNIYHESVHLLHKVDDYTKGTRDRVVEVAKSIRQKYGFDVLKPFTQAFEEEHASEPPAPEASSKAEPKRDSKSEAKSEGKPESKAATAATDSKTPSARANSPFEELVDVPNIFKGDSLQKFVTLVFNSFIRMIRSSVGGFLNVFGFLLSLIIIPIYLYYFLIDSRTIAESWQDYLPLKNSRFKNEVVSTLTEINGYLIAFFRGQLLVSVINGTATAVGLFAIGLDFGLLIGLVLCVLGLIPYVGIFLCWVPAIIIASVQGGVGTWIPANPGWLFPAIVTLIFVIVQKFDSFYITPKVVASTVGLHPMTVIVSLFVWSLLAGGLLGTILAVPLTATLKVLLRRYVWERRILGNQPAPENASAPPSA